MEPVADRFCRYVKIDTRSSEESQTAPSTPGQLDLLRLLERELRDLGLADVQLTDKGVLTATLPSNLGAELDAKVPTIGFLAHVDTYPGVEGKGVKPQRLVYRGGDLALPGDPSQVIRPAESPDLDRYRGKEIITSDGTTLLGADDKAGVAAIMAALEVLVRSPARPHGRVRIGFTPDEEVGRGTENFDIAAFGAKYAYTLDGSAPGEIEDETFCADTAVFTVTGRDHHPGYAKGILVNAYKVAADLIHELPADAAPETTTGREGYLHPYILTGSVAQATLKVLVRDFTVAGLKELERRLEAIRAAVASRYPGATIRLAVEESYRNMKLKLDETPEAVELASEAIRRAGLVPKRASIRGGTDGSRLTLAGLPTPNLFAGGMDFHSKREWVAVEAMEQAVTTVLNLVELWTEWGDRRPGAAN
jgi:tripeptide aminopeptidase